jgi:hypothetical protein
MTSGVPALKMFHVGRALPAALRSWRAVPALLQAFDSSRVRQSRMRTQDDNGLSVRPSTHSGDVVRRACRYRVSRDALGMTMMLLGSVGQLFWQTPQPVQPSS